MVPQIFPPDLFKIYLFLKLSIPYSLMGASRVFGHGQEKLLVRFNILFIAPVLLLSLLHCLPRLEIIMLPQPDLKKSISFIAGQWSIHHEQIYRSENVESTSSGPRLFELSTIGERTRTRTGNKLYCICIVRTFIDFYTFIHTSFHANKNGSRLVGPPKADCRTFTCSTLGTQHTHSTRTYSHT